MDIITDEGYVAVPEKCKENSVELYVALRNLSAWCAENLSYQQFQKAKEHGFYAEEVMAKCREQ